MEALFNIKKAPEKIWIPEDSFESFLTKKEYGKCIKVLSEKQSQEAVSKLYILPSAFTELDMHIKWNKKSRENSNEQGGILVGSIYRDKNSQIVCGVVRHVIPSTRVGNAAYIQFSHEDWILMYREFEEKYLFSGENDSSLRVVGWYHTHPNMPVNMSDIDRQTHRSFFPEVYQFSVIFNPQQGIWAAFNGSECKNCNGILFSKQNETSILRDEEKISKQIRPFIADNLSNGNKELQSYCVDNNIDKKNFKNIFPIDKILIGKLYKRMLVEYKNTGYYLPLNYDQFDGREIFVIDSTTVSRFYSFVNNWEFQNNKNVSLLYSFCKSEMSIFKAQRFNCMYLNVNMEMVADGFIFSTGTDEVIKYSGIYDQKHIVLAVMYSTEKVAGSFSYELYRDCDYVLWLNPENMDDFEFYFVDKKIIRKKFCIKNQERPGIGYGSGYLGQINNYKQDDYMESVSPQNNQKCEKFRIKKIILDQLHQKIKRYDSIKTDFSIVLSFICPYCFINRNIISPWINYFLQIWIFSYDNADKKQTVCMKNVEYERNNRPDLMKFAFIISNKNIKTDDYKDILKNHLAAYCLNITTQENHFYGAFWETCYVCTQNLIQKS